MITPLRSGAGGGVQENVTMVGDAIVPVTF